MEEKQGKLLPFLYETAPGRFLLRGLTHPAISKIAGAFLDTRASTVLIRSYVRKYHIDLSLYEPVQYRSFNQFFTRKIRPENRPFAMGEHDLPSPCDGKLTVFPITPDAQFTVKGQIYTLDRLLRDENLANQFQGGYCFIFRLTVDDYHRYHYLDSGTKEEDVFLSGKLHTVRPIALLNRPVFCENSRAYTVLHTDHFGQVVQVEVGALLVGRICNLHGAGPIQRGRRRGASCSAAPPSSSYSRRTPSGRIQPFWHALPLTRRRRCSAEQSSDTPIHKCDNSHSSLRCCGCCAKNISDKRPSMQNGGKAYVYSGDLSDERFLFWQNPRL